MLNNQSLSKAYSVPYGRVHLTSRFQVIITFSKIRLKKEKIKGNVMVVTKVDRSAEFMSRRNYASLTHQIADWTHKP